MPARGCERRCGRRSYRPRGQHRRRARRGARYHDCAGQRREPHPQRAQRADARQPADLHPRGGRGVASSRRTELSAERAGATISQHAHPGDRARVSTAHGREHDRARRAGACDAGVAHHERFPAILADTVGRTLRESYRAAPTGVRALARQTTAADFRTKHRLMLDSTGVTLEKVNEAWRVQKRHDGGGGGDLQD